MLERVEIGVNQLKNEILPKSQAAAQYNKTARRAALAVPDRKPLHATAMKFGLLDDEFEKARSDAGKRSNLLSQLIPATGNVAPLTDDRFTFATKTGNWLETSADSVAVT